jgi:crotonobetainyl-CoA:carnitine CoA-transferase CaiB-like acyl-CoA transferase
MPVKAGVALIDILTGLNASIAILAAVEHRNKTGEGQHIDLSLFDVGVASLANQALNYLVSDEPPQRMGNAHPNIVPYQAFETADGHIILAVGNDSQFQRFCAVAGQPELAEDSRFSTNINRVISRDILVPLLEPLLREDTTDNWLVRLAAVSVPAGPVNDLARVFDEPQARHRGLASLAEAEDGVHSISHPMVASPLRLSSTPASTRLPAPFLGAHTRRVLQSVLGLEDDTINQLETRGIIQSARER